MVADIMLTVADIENGQPIPTRYAYCMADGKGGAQPGQNIRPAMRWEQGPDGTKSYAIIVVDRDVPTSFDNANKIGQILPSSMPRQSFSHWIQTDIPASVTSLPEGPGGEEVVDAGVSGTNDVKAGNGIGYDGPCPPWNDEKLHHYHFVVYALDVGILNLQPSYYTATEMESAMEGHALAKGEIVGTYTNNQSLLKK